MSDEQQSQVSAQQALCDFDVIFLRGGSDTIHGRMTEINRNGAHIAIDEAAGENQVIRLRVDFPLDPSINFLARVLKVVSEDEASEARPAGMSVTIFAMEREEREQWVHILERCVRDHGNLIEEPESTAGRDLQAPGATLPPPKPRERRQYERYRAMLSIELHDMSSLFEMYTRDISAGGAFIQTDKQLKNGSLVRLSVVHPITNQKYELDGEVVRAEKDGADIKFFGMDPKTRKGFMRFIVTGRLPH